VTGLCRPAKLNPTSDVSTVNETEKYDWGRFDALTDAEAHEAALKDPDAQPLRDKAPALMKPVPRARTLRRALGLTQEEFAARYHIPIGTCATGNTGARSLTSQRAPILP
jgi:DNA-binding transcriptional regulator YiaG